MAIAPGEGINAAQANAATIAARKAQTQATAAAAQEKSDASIADSDARLRAFGKTSPNYVPDVEPDPDVAPDPDVEPDPDGIDH
jgi:hypothetical protein